MCIKLDIQSNVTKSGSLTRDFWYLAIIAAYMALFLPPVFIANQDINLIVAFEVDPGSIFLAIDDLFRPGEAYNMLAGYHSRYYGWTFNAILFWAYAPMHYILGWDQIGYDTPRYLFYRATFFLIGLAAISYIYVSIRDIFPKLPAAMRFLLVMAFLTSPIASIFYFIHPESTGALFYVLAIICVHKLIWQNDARYYWGVVVFLALSALSKQVFFFLAAPLFCLAFWHFLDITSERFNVRNIVLGLIPSLALSLLVVLFIHPYSIWDFGNFLKYQQELLLTFSGETNKNSILDRVNLWVSVIRDFEFLAIGLVILPIVLLVQIRTFWKIQSSENAFHLTMSVTVALMLVLVVYGNALYFAPNYLLPVAVPLIFVFAYAMQKVLRTNILRPASFFAVIYVFSVVIVLGLSRLLPVLESRLDYKTTLAFRTYGLADGMLSGQQNQNNRVAHDYLVAIPSKYTERACHIWRGCGTDYIETFNPDYIILSDYPSVVASLEYKRMQKYIKDYDMKLVVEQDGVSDIFVDSKVANTRAHTVRVYAKPNVSAGN